MIRQLASVLSDVLDTVFNIDSRVFRSLFPLYFRPGYLTLEYFAGRRVRYVTPFRLFFFLCLVAFFAIQLALNLDRFRFQVGPQRARPTDIESRADRSRRQERTAQALPASTPQSSAAHMPAGADRIARQGQLPRSRRKPTIAWRISSRAMQRARKATSRRPIRPTRKGRSDVRRQAVGSDRASDQGVVAAGRSPTQSSTTWPAARRKTSSRRRKIRAA